MGWGVVFFLSPSLFVFLFKGGVSFLSLGFCLPSKKYILSCVENSSLFFSLSPLSFSFGRAAHHKKEEEEEEREEEKTKTKMSTTTATRRTKTTTTTLTTLTTTTTKKKKKKKSTKESASSSSSSSFLRRHVVLPVSDVLNAIASMNYRQLTLQLLSLTLIVTSALMIWKSLCLYTHSESPVVVVLSGSMEPAFKRGDILFLSLNKKKGSRKNSTENEEYDEERTRVGEIIVFSIDGRDIPIVHRVIKSHFHPSSSSFAAAAAAEKDKYEDVATHRGGGASSSSSSDRSDDRSGNESVSSSSSFKHEMLTKGDNNYMDDIGLYAPGQKWLNEKHVMGRTVGYLPHVGKATILMNDHPMIKYGLILILGLLVISGKEG